MTNRVKYYSSNDLLYGHNLLKIEALQIPLFDALNVNDAIEFLEIKKYFDSGTRSKTWSDEEYKSYMEKCDTLAGFSKRFFNQINDENIICVYNAVEADYHSAFWGLFDNCKVYNRISDEIFAVLINGGKVSPHDLFLHKNIVRRFGKILREYILSSEYCITIVLHVYEQEYVQGDKLTLPAELTGEDICDYIDRYIDGDHPNPNHLHDIIDMRYTKQFPITDEVRLKAKKRYEAELENISKTGVSISHGIQLSIEPQQNEVTNCSYDDQRFTVSYSAEWLLETLDYPSILNNFIYVFEYVDFPQMRCTHVNKVSQSGVFERAFASKSTRVYPCNYAFKFNQGLASMQLHAYYDFLEKHNIHLEDVIEWFFTKQIQEEYGCAEIRLSMPTACASYGEKCSSIITAFESILKQYSLYVRNGNIDFELVGMSTTPTRFEDIKSLVKDKYIYGVGEDYSRLSFWLFSDQCMFSYVDRLDKDGHRYDCFCDLLLNETIFLSDYREDEKSAFENMASFDLISITEEGNILPKDKIKLAVLRDLFNNDVISKKHYPTSANYAINDLLGKGVIETKSTLFSQPETDYLNYLLNRAEYSNGLEIRNRYIHGIQQVNTNQDEHRHNYFTLLRLFILLAIKINDDLASATC